MGLNSTSHAKEGGAAQGRPEGHAWPWGEGGYHGLGTGALVSAPPTLGTSGHVHSPLQASVSPSGIRNSRDPCSNILGLPGLLRFLGAHVGGEGLFLPPDVWPPPIPSDTTTLEVPLIQSPSIPARGTQTCPAHTVSPVKHAPGRRANLRTQVSRPANRTIKPMPAGCCDGVCESVKTTGRWARPPGVEAGAALTGCRHRPGVSRERHSPQPSWTQPLFHARPLPQLCSPRSLG